MKNFIAVLFLVVFSSRSWSSGPTDSWIDQNTDKVAAAENKIYAAIKKGSARDLAAAFTGLPKEYRRDLYLMMPSQVSDSFRPDLQIYLSKNPNQVKEALLRTLVQSGYRVDMALEYAVKEDDLAFYRILKKLGAKLDSPPRQYGKGDQEVLVPASDELSLAASTGARGVLKEILAKPKVDPNQPQWGKLDQLTPFQITELPLYQAVRRAQDAETARILLQHGAKREPLLRMKAALQTTGAEGEALKAVFPEVQYREFGIITQGSRYLNKIHPFHPESLPQGEPFFRITNSEKTFDIEYCDGKKAGCSRICSKTKLEWKAMFNNFKKKQQKTDPNTDMLQACYDFIKTRFGTSDLPKAANGLKQACLKNSVLEAAPRTQKTH